MFASVIHARDTGRVAMCRDRLGIKPLYYSQKGARLRFASTLPALVAAGAGIHEWHSLKDGLITLHEGEAIADKIKDLSTQSVQARRARSERARLAAERLNRDTIGEWADLILRAARSPR